MVTIRFCFNWAKFYGDYWPDTLEQALIMYGLSAFWIFVWMTLAFGFEFRTLGKKVIRINLYSLFAIFAYAVFSALWPYNVLNYIMIVILIVVIVINTKKGRDNKRKKVNNGSKEI